MILLIDNYDSFTYNLYQQVSRLGGQVRVVKNDALSMDQIRAAKPEKLILSPGPRTPAHSGVCIPVIQAFYQTIPILGICLGHQCLAVAFGQHIQAARQLVFGKTTPVTHTGSSLMSGVPQIFQAARYHSLVINAVPDGFSATSQDDRGDIMSMEHTSLPLYGLQFHPESFLMEPTGDQMIANFLDI